jgi:NhaP-type Na+/H+ or K+/H+ antiporter
VILPILIFGSSFSSDLHLFLKQLVPVSVSSIFPLHLCLHIHKMNPPSHLTYTQVLTLAGPAVLVNTALLGVTAKYVLPYGWDWPTALLFGSMLRWVTYANVYIRIHLCT